MRNAMGPGSSKSPPAKQNEPPAGEVQISARKANMLLFDAAMKGKALQPLLNKGADVNAALRMAAENTDVRNVQAVQALLQADADVNAQDEQGSTALMMAAYQNHVGVVKALIAADADVNKQDNAIGNTALMFAVIQGHVDSVKALIAAGADVEKQNEHGNTALMMAAYHNHVNIGKELLRAGADVNAQNEQGNTALMIATLQGQLDSVKALIAANADVEKQDNAIGNTALIVAANKGHVEIVQALIAAGANVDKPNNHEHGITALMMAAHHNHVGVVKKLLGAGADVNAQNEQGENALKIATNEGHKQIVNLLNGRSLRGGARPCHSIRGKKACWARAHCMRKDKRCVPRDYYAIARGEITPPRGAATDYSLDTVVLRARPIRKVFHIDSIVRVNGEWAEVVDVLSRNRYKLRSMERRDKTFIADARSINPGTMRSTSYSPRAVLKLLRLEDDVLRYTRGHHHSSPVGRPRCNPMEGYMADLGCQSRGYASCGSKKYPAHCNPASNGLSRMIRAQANKRVHEHRKKKGNAAFQACKQECHRDYADHKKGRTERKNWNRAKNTCFHNCKALHYTS